MHAQQAEKAMSADRQAYTRAHSRDSGGAGAWPLRIPTASTGGRHASKLQPGKYPYLSIDTEAYIRIGGRADVGLLNLRYTVYNTVGQQTGKGTAGRTAGMVAALVLGCCAACCAACACCCCAACCCCCAACCCAACCCCCAACCCCYPAPRPSQCSLARVRFGIKPPGTS